MKKFIYFSMLVFASLQLSACSTAHDADGKPYLVNAQLEQKNQWRREPWKVEDWAATPQKGQEQVDAFFRADILRDYVTSSWGGGDRVLIVGPGFYHLSGFDQQRVITLFSSLYQPEEKNTKTIELKDWYTGRIIGVYTGQGLQLS